MIVSKATELPLYRLYLLRALYALIGVAQGLQTWPAIVHHAHPWDFWHGVGMSFLGALTALALLGVRYPVRMMPLLFFEFAWKFLWAATVWLPVALSHAANPDVNDNAFPIIMGVILVPLVLPWGYVWKTYVVAPSDRWR